MSISEEERDILIRHRINKAEEMIVEVQYLITGKHYNTAVNRIYYGMFYMLSALALKKNFTTSKHQQLLGWFNREFIKSNVIETQFGNIIKTAFEMRSRSDYDDFVKYSEEETSGQFEAMKKFISRLMQFMSE